MSFLRRIFKLCTPQSSFYVIEVNEMVHGSHSKLESACMRLSRYGPIPMKGSSAEIVFCYYFVRTFYLNKLIIGQATAKNGSML